tara:strand:+ start:273 stop:725 length:453 start_codon:yes stop_codon:yes gene_type:complete
MGRWYRYYQEPTTELGRRVQFGVLVVVLIAMGFFTWGATWICLAVLGILWAKDQPAFVRPQVATRHTKAYVAPTLTGTYPSQSRFPNDFPGLREWCAARIKRVGFKETPDYLKTAMETGNPGYLPTYLLQEFYGTPAYKAWKQQQQQQQQ